MIGNHKLINSLYSYNDSKGSYYSDASGHIKPEDIDDIYKDALIQQAVDVPIQDAISNWLEIEEKNLADYVYDFDLKSVFMEAGIHARKYGSAMLLPVIIGSKGNKIGLGRSLDSLSASDDSFFIAKVVLVKNFSKSEVIDSSDVLSDNYGKPKSYSIGGSQSKSIHPSRVIIINANGAGVSLIESIYDYYRDFIKRRDETTRATEESNWLILKTNLEMLYEEAMKRAEASGSTASVEGEVDRLMRNRLSEMRSNANNNNAYGIDKNEEEIEQISKNNISQLVSATEQSFDHLTAAIDIISLRFFGKGVGGLSDSNDFKIYNVSLIGLRSFMFDPALKRFFKMVKVLDKDIVNTGYSWNKTPIENLIVSGVK